MILLTKARYTGGIECIDFSRVDWFEVSTKIIRVIFPNSEFAHVIELGVDLTDKQKEQLAYYISILKNKDDVTELNELLKAIKAKDRYDKYPNKDNFKKADLVVAEAKFFCSNAAYESADRAVQIFGGRGWSYLYRVGRHYIDNRVCKIYEGSDEIMKLKIASSILGKDYRAYG